METNKITQEELSQLQSIVEQYESVSFRIGQYTIEIESAKAERKTMIDQATQLLQNRNAVLETLEQKYGRDVKVNVQTGELVKNG
jgi:enamine deaminase RidA (YjgF/YER057c/UK114 family)